MAFALSGVIVMLRKRMDIVGICACGLLAAFGGGSLRDVLLDRRPLFWVVHQYVLLGVLAISIAGATVVSRRRHAEGHTAVDAKRIDSDENGLSAGICAGLKTGSDDVHHMLEEWGGDTIHVKGGGLPPATKSAPRTTSRRCRHHPRIEEQRGDGTCRRGHGDCGRSSGGR